MSYNLENFEASNLVAIYTLAGPRAFSKKEFACSWYILNKSRQNEMS